MRLIQSRVKCVKGVTDSGWFLPARESTLLYGPECSKITDLLKALESLNPLYDIEQIQPLADHPKEWRQGQYKRRVIPEKKTAVIMVFSAEPELVLELSEIDPALIETDRVEAGRRLDNSRWITFVEIPTSTRWSEVAEPIRQLHDKLMEQVQDRSLRSRLQQLWSCLKDLQPTDRLTKENADLCCDWLDNAIPLMADGQDKIAKECRFKAKRAERFRNAREHVQRWLPPVIKISRNVQLLPRYSYAEVTDDQYTVDPVTLLLKKIIDKGVTKTTHSRENFYQNILASRNKVSAYTSSMKLPELRLNENGFEFGLRPDAGRALQRMATILTICLLTDLCGEPKPLLLLDQLADDLNGDDQRLMVGWMQQLGTENQLILSTAKRDVTQIQGWQKVFDFEEGASTTSLISRPVS